MALTTVSRTIRTTLVEANFCRQRFASTTASDAASRLMETLKGTVQKRRQVLDGNQLQRLSLTLNRSHLHPGLNISKIAPLAGTPVPPGYHLVYFTPQGCEVDLGIDGTDRAFNSPAPFTRRMWAGGRIKWTKDRPLRVGEEVEERTRLLSAVPKTSRDGSDMILVSVEKEFWGNKGLAPVDQRSWIFRVELQEPADDKKISTRVAKAQSSCVDLPRQNSAFPERQMSWSLVALFRFSALTFNAHRIHYDGAWSQGVENHPGLVVHGPLNLINMLDYWRDTHTGEGA
ncbi:hypothetical protein GGI43DRAFT_419303 [Trichoderma evansii]